VAEISSEEGGPVENRTSATSMCFIMGAAGPGFNVVFQEQIDELCPLLEVRSQQRCFR
jgi:hypothetical protein